MAPLTGPLAIACILQLLACQKSGSSGTGEGGDPIRVAAASDLAVAFRVIGDDYEKKTGRHVDFTFGSSGLLAKQVEEGAPFDVFAGANMAFVDEAIKSGACDGATKTRYALGALAIWTKSGDAPKLADLADEKYKRIAIANPDHAPYGKAAKEALQKAGVWDKIEKRMVYGENVQQAHQFAKSGNADVAIVGLGLAMSATDGKFAPIDSALHAPLEQALVVCKGKGGPRDRAKDFAAYISSKDGRAVLDKHGFVLPKD
jgi:molybdate transport system substrate-binding protein